MQACAPSIRALDEGKVGAGTVNSMDISVYSHIVLSLNVGSMYRMNRECWT
jgi:hypothetical protein